MKPTQHDKMDINVILHPQNHQLPALLPNMNAKYLMVVYPGEGVSKVSQRRSALSKLEAGHRGVTGAPKNKPCEVAGIHYCRTQHKSTFQYCNMQTYFLGALFQGLLVFVSCFRCRVRYDHDTNCS